MASPPRTPPSLTRPDGSLPRDFQLSRRSLAGVVVSGCAAYALSAEADPIHTDEIGLTTETLTFEESGDSLPAYVAKPEAKGRRPAIIVVLEVFGVHEYIKDICRRLAKLGYVAVAPSFFFRADPNNTLATTTDFSIIQRIVAATRNDQVLNDVAAAIAWLEKQRFVDKKRLAITGYCWGGAVVWMSVDRFPSLKAGVEGWAGFRPRLREGSWLMTNANGRWMWPAACTRPSSGSTAEKTKAFRRLTLSPCAQSWRPLGRARIN